MEIDPTLLGVGGTVIASLAGAIVYMFKVILSQAAESRTLAQASIEAHFKNATAVDNLNKTINRVLAKTVK